MDNKIYIHARCQQPWWLTEPKQLKLSIDYSKVAVGILSNDSEEYDFKMALDKQLNKPKQFIEEIHEDDFGHSYITRKTGPGAYLE